MKRAFAYGVMVLLIIGVLFAFGDALLAMVQHWSASPMYSHAYTVPLISLGLLWSRRQRFRELAPRPAHLAAVPLLVMAILMLVIGEVAAVQIAQQLAFVVTIAAIVLFLFGFDWFMVSAPAVAYLLFMVPFWDAFTEPLHEPFQHNSALLGVALMKMIGVPAFREGTMIALPNVNIEVARACSGVNYLVAVLALALPLSFLRLHLWSHRVLLITAAMTIAALANGLRVALIGTLAYFEIGSPLHGPFHMLHGLFVAGVGYVVLFGGLVWLERLEAAKLTEPIATPTPRRTAIPWGFADAGGLALVFWIVVFVGIAPSSSPVALVKPLDALPNQLGGWGAEPVFREVRPPATAWTAADQQLRRSYRTREGMVAAVDIWYFSNQSQSREIVSFKVSELHRMAKPHRIDLAGGGTLTANLLAWPDQGEVGMFWYELAGTPESHEYVAKARSMWNALSTGHNNAAAIMLTARADKGRKDEAVRALDTLAAEVHAGLAGHWPGTARSSTSAKD